MARVIKGLTRSLTWLNDLLSFFQSEAIKVPTKYRDRVVETKKLLGQDTSGLVTSLLDFAIDCALVNYTVETDNENLSKILNDWLSNINSDLRGKVPTGIDALAKEYFRERWKGSSNLLLRTFWEEKDKIELPTIIFFLDGEDIIVKRKNKDAVVRLGEEQYYIRVNAQEEHNIKLPTGENELIFVQRPYESWGVIESVPFVIKRGLYRNMKFFELMSQKGEFIISRALEYLFVIKKGTERMAIEGRPEMIYSEEDLRKVKQDFTNLMANKKTEAGTPLYTTNFDTEMEHLIPDYKKAINAAIYAPIERRILAGLGLIDIVTGTSSSRREALLNPKPFITEVKQGIKDFKAMLIDMMEVIKEKNVKTHKKWMNAKITVKSSPCQEFIDDKFRAMIRSGFDRGKVSQRTFVEIGLNMDYDVEVQHRKDEKKKGYDELMYAPVIQNMEGQVEPTDEVPDDKKAIEKKNFLKSIEEVEHEIEEGAYDKDLGKEHKVTTHEFEQAPYTTIEDLPKSVKVLPSAAQSLWKRAFNQSYPKGEDYARKIAWFVVKKSYKKSGDKWVKK